MTNSKSNAVSTVAANQIAKVPTPSRRRIICKPTPAASITSSPTIKVRKRDQLAALLLRDEGATLDQMIAATDWLPHTTRAALTGLKKRGYAIDSDKIEGIRTYRAVAPQ